jgi:hypothetical protein
MMVNPFVVFAVTVAEIALPDVVSKLIDTA